VVRRDPAPSDVVAARVAASVSVVAGPNRISSSGRNCSDRFRLDRRVRPVLRERRRVALNCNPNCNPQIRAPSNDCPRGLHGSWRYLLGEAEPGGGAAYLARQGAAGRRHAGPGCARARPRTGLPLGMYQRRQSGPPLGMRANGGVVEAVVSQRRGKHTSNAVVTPSLTNSKRTPNHQKDPGRA
jgi:hypothetical protein